MHSLGGFGSPLHLAQRFFGSLRPGGPGVADEAWARRWLNPAETKIWSSLSGADRRHAVEVAHHTAADLGNTDGAGVGREVLAAALLHDSGKVESGFGTFGRVAVTLVAMVTGRPRVAAWADERTDGPAGWRRRAGLYVRHDEIGARLLRDAGSNPLTVTWTAEHHLPAERWSLDPRLANALKAADDD